MVPVKVLYRMLCPLKAHDIVLPLSQPLCTGMLQKEPSHPRHTRSSSYIALLIRPAHSKGTLGDRSFSFTASVLNSVLNDLRCAPSLPSFIFRLRTFYSCFVQLTKN